MTKQKEEITNTLIQVSVTECNDALRKNMETIQNNILKILSEKNISQSDLAKAIESEHNHVNYILRKKNKGITIKVLGRIAKSLNIPIYQLLK